MKNNDQNGNCSAPEKNEQEMLISALSHDLRSPLSVINMLANAIKNILEEDKNNTEDAIKMSEMIMEKSSSMMLMIERLLKYSKMCCVVPDFELLDLNTIVEECFRRELAVVQRDKERTVHTEKSQLPVIKGDKMLVEMLFSNLISNAFKFTARGKNTFISVTSWEDDNYYIISVKDNGVGFDMKKSQKIFDIFYRLHSSDEFKGSGVGLAIVDRIIKLHGGKAEAYGEVNKGAELKIYFPK